MVEAPHPLAIEHRALDDRARAHKRAMGRHRVAARECREAQARLERECRRLGVRLDAIPRDDNGTGDRRHGRYADAAP